MSAVVMTSFPVASWHCSWTFKSCKDLFITDSVVCAMLSLWDAIFLIWTQASLDFSTKISLWLTTYTSIVFTVSWIWSTSPSDKSCKPSVFGSCFNNKWELSSNCSMGLIQPYSEPTHVPNCWIMDPPWCPFKIRALHWCLHMFSCLDQGQSHEGIIE